MKKTTELIIGCATLLASTSAFSSSCNFTIKNNLPVFRITLSTILGTVTDPYTTCTNGKVLTIDGGSCVISVPAGGTVDLESKVTGSTWNTANIIKLNCSNSNIAPGSVTFVGEMGYSDDISYFYANCVGGASNAEQGVCEETNKKIYLEYE